MTAQHPTRAWLLAAALIAPLAASASDLSYTFMDFRALRTTLDSTGVQNPVPEQSVHINARQGDGISVAGSLAAGDHFYLAGTFESSIIDLDGVVDSPLTTTNISDTFDLVRSALGLGYQRELAENFDLLAEVSYDKVNYDFGSLAGENFDTKDSGPGGRVGFRWNPKPTFELFASARYTPVGKVQLSERTLEPDTLVDLGFRWYFFETLGAGLEYESGDTDTVTLSLRFSFGNLPW
jgi:hypothetical protein